MKDQFIIKHGALEFVGGDEEDLLGILKMDLSKAIEIKDRSCPKCKRTISLPSEDFLVKYYKTVKSEHNISNTDSLGFKDLDEVYTLCLCGTLVKCFEEHFSHYFEETI